MSEIRDPEKKPEKKNDRDFISEKIVRPAPSRKQVGTRMATAACAGVIFGVVSAVCFVLTRPILEQLSAGFLPTAFTDRLWNSCRQETGQPHPLFPFQRMSWNLRWKQ